MGRRRTRELSGQAGPPVDGHFRPAHRHRPALPPQRRPHRLGGTDVRLSDGGTTLTAALTHVDDAEVSVAAALQRAQRRLVDEVFGAAAGVTIGQAAASVGVTV
nr:hypothetical protein KitaXyl93_72210 [Kitasatospora sp. Xyl93]